MENANKGHELVIYRKEKEIARWDIAARVAKIEQTYGPNLYEVNRDLLTFSRPGVQVTLMEVSRRGDSYSFRGVLLGKE